MDYVVTLPLYLDLAAVFLGGLSGSLHAVRQGFLRDGSDRLGHRGRSGRRHPARRPLAERSPVAFKEPWYLPTVLVAAAIGFFFGSLVQGFRKPIILMDAVWLGLYAVVGAQKALDYGLSGFSAILLGVVTAVGGSVLVDLLAGERPELVQPGPIGHFGAVDRSGGLRGHGQVACRALTYRHDRDGSPGVRHPGGGTSFRHPGADRLDIPETIKRVRARTRRPEREQAAGDRRTAGSASRSRQSDGGANGKAAGLVCAPCPPSRMSAPGPSRPRGWCRRRGTRP